MRPRRPRACARPRFRRRFSEPARRGGLAGARVMSYTILELRKVLVNAQTDGIRHRIPRYAGAPRDRAGVGAAKQVSRAGVKVTTRGMRYGYIGLIFINPRQTPNKRHRVGSVASIRILTAPYLRPELSSYPYSCSTPRRAIRPAASEPSMPRGRVHISMPSIDSERSSSSLSNAQRIAGVRLLPGCDRRCV